MVGKITNRFSTNRFLPIVFHQFLPIVFLGICPAINITGDDLEKAGIKKLETNFQAKNKDGTEMNTPKRDAIAIDKVRHVGDPIAIVIAESVELAKNASEKIIFDIEELPSNTNTSKALGDDSPKIWENLQQKNLCL